MDNKEILKTITNPISAKREVSHDEKMGISVTDHKSATEAVMDDDKMGITDIKRKPTKEEVLYADHESVDEEMLDDYDAGGSDDEPEQEWYADHESSEEEQPPASSGKEDAAEIEDEEIGVAETYSNYEPAKLKLGRSHPDQIVESSSLSSIEPTEIWYSLSLPESTINSCALSALQLEAIIYSAQQHERFLPDGSRAGFLIGDGTGVGKGRTVAGIIFENYLNDRKKALWISVSNDLKHDCERDLKDIGASRIQVHSLNKMEYTKIDSYYNGNVKEGVIYSTYSSLIGKTTSSSATFRTRLEQLIHWCGKDFDGPIIFDESHRAKNLCPGKSRKPTKTGLTVLELQQLLPKARVVYVSATGASELRNMAYMTRLGMWGMGTPFCDFSYFLKVIEKRGVGAMEIVAIDMKLRGMYIARQLSFQGVTFRIEEVPLDAKFIQMYNDSVDLWVEIKEKLNEALDPPDDDDDDDDDDEFLETGNNKKKYNKSKLVWGQFWSAHQRFFKYLCIAAKVKRTVELAKAAIKDGKCVVIGLLTTGEAQTLNRLEREEGELSDFVSTAKGVLQNFVEKHYPLPEETYLNKSKQSKSSWTSMEESNLSDSDSNDSSDEVDSDEMLWEGYTSKIKSTVEKKKEKRWSKRAKVDAPMKSRRFKDTEEPEYSEQKELLEKIEVLGERLPTNALDQLIDELGGPEIVGEMTGRKGRIVQADGNVEYESRAGMDASLENLNLIEKQRFMDGERNIVIISEVASSGISLHSDRRAKNQRRRVHITLEMPWSADKAMQQFGRTHRSNQVNAPEYVFLISDLAGERRFASSVAKQLESLGALTHGDRRATETRDLSRFNIYNKYGRAALDRTLRGISGIEGAFLPPPDDYKGNFFSDITRALTSVGIFKTHKDGVLDLNKDARKITKFLNRLLGLKVDLQNRLFKYFHDVLHAIVMKAKKDGKFDLGILDLGSAGEDVKRVKTYTFLRKHMAGVATTHIHAVHVERGMSWEEAFAKYSELSGPQEGFYLSRHALRNDKRTTVLAIFSPLDRRTETSSSDGSHSRDTYTVYRPNIGLQPRKDTLVDLRIRYEKVDASIAEKYWTDQYKISENTCSHAYWNGFCKNVTIGLRCEYGLRKRTYVILSGSILNLWTRIEAVLARRYGSDTKLQIVRLKTTDGYKTIGTIVPNGCVELLRRELASDSEKTTEETFVANCNVYLSQNDEELLYMNKRGPSRKKNAKKPLRKRCWRRWRR